MRAYSRTTDDEMANFRGAPIGVRPKSSQTLSEILESGPHCLAVSSWFGAILISNAGNA